MKEDEKMKMKKNNNKIIMDLDGAGIIYPYVAKDNWNNVYRIEAEMTEQIDLNALSRAVHDQHIRYPHFFLKVVKVGSNMKLRYSDDEDIIVRENETPCKPFKVYPSPKPLIRVTYGNKRIGVEIFHTVADGHGGFEFFKSLIRRYLVHDGKIVDNTDLHDEMLKNISAETEDIYEKIYKLGGKSISRIIPHSYSYSKKAGDLSKFSAAEISIPFENIYSVAKSKDVTITMLITAIQIYAYAMTREPSDTGKISISVPVDIRRFFNSKTTRNGALYIMPEINAKKVTSFDEILKSVKEQFIRDITKENMQNMAYTNVSTAKSPVFTALPIPVKKMILGVGFNLMGDKQYSGTITNLGKINLGAEVEPYVIDSRYILGKQPFNPFNITVSSYNNNLRLTASYSGDCSEIFKNILGTMNQNGIIPKLKTLSWLGETDMLSLRSNKAADDYEKPQSGAVAV